MGDTVLCVHCRGTLVRAGTGSSPATAACPLPAAPHPHPRGSDPRTALKRPSEPEAGRKAVPIHPPRLQGPNQRCICSLNRRSIERVSTLTLRPQLPRSVSSPAPRRARGTATGPYDRRPRGDLRAGEGGRFLCAERGRGRHTQGKGMPGEGRLAETGPRGARRQLLAADERPRGSPRCGSCRRGEGRCRG